MSEVIVTKPNSRNSNNDNFKAIKKWERIIWIQTDQIKAMSEKNKNKKLNAKDLHERELRKQRLESKEKMLFMV